MIDYETVAVWSQVGSAVLFVITLVLVWNKYIAPAVVSAQGATNERIAEAARHRDDAKASLAGLQADVAAARRDASSIAERAHAQAEVECERIVADAHDAGKRGLENAKGELDRARAAARLQLRDELLARAVAIARGRAHERVDDAVNRRLVGNFVQSLERRHGG